MSALVWYLWEPSQSSVGCGIGGVTQKKKNIYNRQLDPYESKYLKTNLHLSFPPNFPYHCHHQIVLIKLENITFISQNKTLGLHYS